MERNRLFVVYVILCTIRGSEGTTTVGTIPNHQATDESITEAALVTAQTTFASDSLGSNSAATQYQNTAVTDADEATQYQNSAVTDAGEATQYQNTAVTDAGEVVTASEYADDPVTPMTQSEEEEEEVEDVVDMDLPTLPEECSHVTDLERETGIFLGRDATECSMNIIVTYYDIFYDVTSDDCMLCRCNKICPGLSEKEIEDIYDDWVKSIGNKVVWNKWSISQMTVYCAIMFIGTIGNILVLVTVIKIFRPVSVTNMFIASLATADLMVSSTIVPFQAYLKTQNGLWTMSSELCRILYYGYYAFFMASVFSLTAMSLERFFVICYPMKAQYMSTPKRAKVIIAIVWPLAFSMALPVAFQTDKLRGECRVIRKQQADDDWSGPLYIYITAVLFVLPACIIGYAYIRTSLALLASIKSAKGMTNEKDEEKKKESKDVRSRLAVIRMLITIWLVFIACWAPFIIFMLIDIYADEWLDGQLSVSAYNHLMPALEMVTFTNSALNPVLYAFMSRQFRRGFMKCFLCCLDVARSKSSTTDSSSGFSRTRVTTAVTSVAATVKSTH